MNKHRVLLVIADSSKTGAPRQVSYLVSGLVNAFEVHVACPEGWLATEARARGATVHEFDNNQSILRIKNDLTKLYARLDPDIIHCHGVRGGVAGRFAQWQRAKMIYTEHRWTHDFHLPSILREQFQLFVLRYLRARTDHTIAVSKVVHRFLLDAHIADKEKSSVIYGGIEPLHAEAPVNDPVIGTLGHLTWIKGIDILLKALAVVKKQGIEVRCKIGGSGDDEERLKTLAQQLGIESAIEWLGEVKKPEEFYSTLAIYVHPALTETFGMTILEAMSAGVPVIATTGGAVPEIVHADEAVLVEPQNIHELASAIINLISDKDARNSLREKGLLRVKEFLPTQTVQAHVELYERLLR